MKGGTDTKTEVLKAVANDDLTKLKQIFAKCASAASIVNCKDNSQQTPLHIASLNKSLEVVNLLLGIRPQNTIYLGAFF